MSGFIIMGEEADRFIDEKYESQRKDFEENAEKFGLNKEKAYDFICLSFEPNQSILPSIKEKLLNWPAGPCRGYVNAFDILCINMPMTPGEDAPEEENIFDFLKKANQEYYDLESANWGCYRVDFPDGVDTLEYLIDLWNENVDE